MGTFTDRLMGEVIENPDGQERDVELLLLNLLRCLIEEQKFIDANTINTAAPIAAHTSGREVK